MTVAEFCNETTLDKRACSQSEINDILLWMLGVQLLVGSQANCLGTTDSC